MSPSTDPFLHPQGLHYNKQSSGSVCSASLSARFQKSWLWMMALKFPRMHLIKKVKDLNNESYKNWKYWKQHAKVNIYSVFREILLKCLYYRISAMTRKRHNGIVHRNTQSNNNDICKEPQKILNSQSNPEHNGRNWNVPALKTYRKTIVTKQHVQALKQPLRST